MAPRLHPALPDLTRYARVDQIQPTPLAEITSMLEMFTFEGDRIVELWGLSAKAQAKP
ncbi:hypothetical protein [Micromonospora pallida]|uniref:hypothetical protein n=1 Tax=Micromonospora pallida TaxID=145854 RepID=UPI00159F11CD|nr:hypothetical protein [Micromonospora pallida]